MRLLSALRGSKMAAVLGCGPAGLFAAHALVQNGWDVTIYSRKRRSEMFGAQYLHKPIPGLTIPHDEGKPLRYCLTGSVDDYRRKVYGDAADVTVSAEILLGTHRAWNIREAYFMAWNDYVEQIVHVDTITPGWLTSLTGDYRLVVSTIPAQNLCTRSDEHRFNSKLVWAIGDAPERGIFCPVSVLPMTVELNGDRDVGWYRASNVFGYSTVEWPERRRPPIEGVASVSKPISTNCDCFPNVVRLGRYGKWTKGVLSHHAYEEALSL